MYCVYKHTSPTGKVYIGITKRNPQKRWNGGNGYSSNRYFFRAILKYGWGNFKHEIIETKLTQEQAVEKERYYIKLYNSTDPERGYNIEAGGISGSAKFTESMRKTFSERGKRVTEERPELIEIMQNAQRAYFAEQKNRDKQSATLKRYYANHPEARERISCENKVRWTKEVRERFGETQKRVQGTEAARKRARESHTHQMKAVEQLTIDGVVIARYDGVGDAVRATGICRTNICSVLNRRKTKAGNERQTAGGYRWRYSTGEAV